MDQHDENSADWCYNEQEFSVSVFYSNFTGKDVQPLLNIFFGDMPTAIYNTEVFFKNTYEDNWLLDDFAKEVIMDVDGSEVIDAQLIKSPVLGMIPPTDLSGGAKTLLLIKNCPEKVFNASTCGDNCAKYILNQCDIDNFFRTGTNGVHAPHPFHLIFDFKLFRNALLRCHLIY